MASDGFKKIKSKSPLVRGRSNRFLRRLIRINAPAPANIPETWEDEDYFHADVGEETIFDPWRDYLPEQQLASQPADKHGAPDAPPLPSDSSFAELPEATEGEDASAEPESVEESEDLTVKDLGGSAEEYYSDPEDFEGTSAHFDDPDGEADEELFDPTFDFEAELFDIDTEPHQSIWDDDPEDPERAFAHFDDHDEASGQEAFGSTFDLEGELLDYDAEARQSVWDDEPEDVADSLLHARQKAAEIVSRLPYTPQQEQNVILLWLTDLFQSRAHHVTYRAILAAVDNGVSGETLRNMVTLRDTWEDRQDWWLGRYGWARSVRPLNNGSTALTWKLARAICEARSDFPPEYMIDEAWITEWLCLHPWDTGFLNFPQFIGLKIMTVDETFQNTPSWRDLPQSQINECIDRRNWVKSVLSDIETSP